MKIIFIEFCESIEILINYALKCSQIKVSVHTHTHAHIQIEELGEMCC